MVEQHIPIQVNGIAYIIIDIVTMHAESDHIPRLNAHSQNSFLLMLSFRQGLNKEILFMQEMHNTTFSLNGFVLS